MSYHIVSHDGLRIQNAILHLFQKASVEVCIASSTLRDFVVFNYMKSSTCLFSAYVNMLRTRGINISILTTPKMLFSRFVGRLHPTIEVSACARNHLKMICIDNKYLYMGTANMTPSAVGLRSEKKRNFEIGFITNDNTTVRFCRSLFEAIRTGNYCKQCQYLERKDMRCTIRKAI